MGTLKRPVIRCYAIILGSADREFVFDRIARVFYFSVADDSKDKIKKTEKIDMNKLSFKAVFVFFEVRVCICNM